MGRVDDLRASYDAVRDDLARSDALQDQLSSWSSGDFAFHYFGSGANALDGLCLLGAWEKGVYFALAKGVRGALTEGRSWNEIAAALGVSRQAARKRFWWVDG